MNNKKSAISSQHNDPEMQDANRKAQETFKYFWRELSWEYRRIVPLLELAIVKVAFRDDSITEKEKSIEYMWINDIEFDGRYISGFLMNTPNWLTNVREGDHVKVKLHELNDWMFVVHGRVFGGFTVNLLRSRMEPKELREHDQAWGYDFGDPEFVELVYADRKKTTGLSKFFNKNNVIEEKDALVEHPMSVNMGESLIEELKKSSELIDYVDGDGWSLLHREALSGNATSVKILLEYGADKSLKNKDGVTPIELAKVFNWEKVIELLSEKVLH
ncbi:DUF2314 domain-containing protein [Aliikangiella sp. IMCC44359]|uniref:DUF2314 domain-containing protein n=1 Tax=Aliikangiella sp. IMCC44359 TaxID=3459125 RepID=UPI00403B2A2C